MIICRREICVSGKGVVPVVPFLCKNLRAYSLPMIRNRALTADEGGIDMQASIKRFFRKDSFLMWSVVIGSILWLTNAAFNFAAKDYRAFCINLLYVVCLLTLGVAAFRQEKDIVQGMIGGSEKILLFEAIILLYRKADENH